MPKRRGMGGGCVSEDERKELRYLNNLKMKIRRPLVWLFDSTCMHWKLHVTIISKFIRVCLQEFKLYNKCTLFDFLILLAYLYWKWLVIIASKSVTPFSEKSVYFIYHYSSQRRMILSGSYIARGGTVMNYAKRVVIFLTMYIFFNKEYLIR